MSEVTRAVQELASELRQHLAWARDLGAVEIPYPPPAPPPERAWSEPGPPPARSAPRRAASPPVGSVPTDGGRAAAPTGPGLEQIRHELGDCRRCPLAETRRNIVFGAGAADADLLIAGEAPGYNEDLTGEPFVGRAGRLLNRMLGAIGLKREAVYICNVLKCRPPNNRDPQPAEVATCSPFLHQQVRAVSPRVIMAVGGFAGRTIAGLDESVGRLRQQTRSFMGIPVVVTYHPAYLLRNPPMKARAWQDLLRARDILRAP